MALEHLQAHAIRTLRTHKAHRNLINSQSDANVLLLKNSENAHIVKTCPDNRFNQGWPETGHGLKVVQQTPHATEGKHSEPIYEYQHLGQRYALYIPCGFACPLQALGSTQ
ncbi:MAG TPA: hypothetical protein DCM28_12455 [Phycisphaerales bacterium]|nr:hypothetical protein [Phycisphaerales bacterium]